MSYVRLRRTTRVSSRCGDGATFLYGEREEVPVRLTEARAAYKGDYEKKKAERRVGQSSDTRGESLPK